MSPDDTPAAVRVIDARVNASRALGRHTAWRLPT
jgi:hypothetical protein